MLLTLFLIKTDIGFCAAPTLEWTGAEGLWNDGVTPDYGVSPTLNSLNPLCTGLDAPYGCCTGASTGTCDIPDNDDCTGGGNPYACCTSTGTGSCDNSDCTALDIPYDCCTGAGTGTCNSFNAL